MRRFSVDNSIIYSAMDLVLFRESPFAVWMERLALENPGHGIIPDQGSKIPISPYTPQVAFARRLQERGRDVAQIGWHIGERERREATLAAMHEGVQFIIDGQLCDGPLAGPVNLLVRTSGQSHLGAYLYLPGDTQGNDSQYDPFRLCFSADLLAAMQGCLPPYLLLAQPDDELLSMQTEDHIQHYREIKAGFLAAQTDFSPNDMPDPSESAHHGRWSDYGDLVLRKWPMPTAISREMPQSRRSALISKPVKQEPNIEAMSRPVVYNFEAFSRCATWASVEEGTLVEQAQRLKEPGTESMQKTGQQKVSLEQLEHIAQSAASPEIMQALTGESLAHNARLSRSSIGAHIWCTPTSGEYPAESPEEIFHITVSGNG